MVLWFNTLNIAWLLYFNVIFQMKMNVHSIIFQTINPTMLYIDLGYHTKIQYSTYVHIDRLKICIE